MRKFKSHRRKENYHFVNVELLERLSLLKENHIRSLQRRYKRVVNATAETKYFTYPLVTDTLINSGVSSGAFSVI